MFKYAIVILAGIACAAAKPGILAYSSPLIAAAPGVVTATSSQLIARNYNGIVSAPIFAPTPLAARYLASPYIAAAPLASTPLAANYIASPYAAAGLLGYSAPLGYASAYGYASPFRYTASTPVLL